MTFLIFHSLLTFCSEMWKIFAVALQILPRFSCGPASPCWIGLSLCRECCCGGVSLCLLHLTGMTSPHAHVLREGPQICRKCCWKCCQEPNWKAEGLALYDPFICLSPLFLYINLCVGPLCWSPVVPSSSQMPSYGGFLIVFSNMEAAMAD